MILHTKLVKLVLPHVLPVPPPPTVLPVFKVLNTYTQMELAILHALLDISVMMLLVLVNLVTLLVELVPVLPKTTVLLVPSQDTYMTTNVFLNVQTECTKPPTVLVSLTTIVDVANLVTTIVILATVPLKLLVILVLKVSSDNQVLN